MRLERKDIEDMLPHRAPILLADSIDVATPGEAGVGQVRLPADTVLWDSWTGDHLTDELILEGAAQVLGVVMSTGPARPDGPGQRLLLSFDKVEFHAAADPGKDIQIQVRVEGRFGAMSVGDFSASQDGLLLAVGKIGVMGG